jgi:hypothetical protein
MIIGIKNAQLEAPFHSSHFSAKLITISSLAICDGGTPLFTGVSLKLKSRPLALRPGVDFFPDTLYVAEAKRPFGGARNLKRAVV